MEKLEDIETLEKFIGQLHVLHSEISQLARKSPNDGLNEFKLKLVNKILKSGNSLMIGSYRPFDDFEQFDEDSLPSNSDVTMIIAQYMEQAERFRSDNVVYHAYKYYYVVKGELTSVEGRKPTKVGGDAK